MKRSDISFVAGAANPLQQLVAYSLGQAPVANVNTVTAPKQSSGSNTGDKKQSGESMDSGATASQTLGNGNLGVTAVKQLSSHVLNNILKGAPLVNPIGLAMTFGGNSALKALFGGTPAEYVVAGIKDAAFSNLNPENSLVLNSMAPAGYESNIDSLMAQSIFNSGMDSRAFTNLNAIANAVNTNNSNATGYGSGVGVGGALGGGVGSMGSSNSYGQGGSYGGGGI